jgi:hypothetical protein
VYEGPEEARGEVGVCLHDEDDFGRPGAGRRASCWLPLGVRHAPHPF